MRTAYGNTYGNETLSMEEFRDYNSLAASLIQDKNRGFISRAENGGGMENAGIVSGDYLLFTKDREPVDGDIVYLEVYGQFMCRRIFFEPAPGRSPGRIRIRREDGITPDLLADERDVQIGGVFEGLIRDNGRRKKTRGYHYIPSCQAERSAKEVKKKKDSHKEETPPDTAKTGNPSMPVVSLGLPARISNLLTGIGMHQVQDILDIPDKEVMLAIPGLGKKTYERILRELERHGFDIRHLRW